MTHTSFTPETMFHLGDPFSSKQAAISLDGTATEKVMHAIVTMIDEHGPLAPFQLEQRYQDGRAERGWPVIAYYGVHKRASDLKKRVLVVEGSGQRATPPVGKAAETLRLTTDATTAHVRITEYMKGAH